MLDFTNTRILITGGSGFLGSHLVRQLVDRGCGQLFVPRRRDYDLVHESAISRLFKTARPEVVIHCAAVVGGILANRANPARFFYENAVMGIQIIEAARRFRVKKIVVLGTICAYPKHTPVPFSEARLWDGYPEETNAPYGIAKKALLVQCQAYRQQYGLNAIYLLPVNLYGPGDNFDTHSSHVIPALVRKCVEAAEQEADEIVCWGDGFATREFLYVEDAAAGIIAATEQYEEADPVNLGTGTEISIRELAETIARLTRYTGKLRWDSSQPNGQPRRCLDVTRAAEKFGFRARIPLDVGLRRTIDWYVGRRAQAAVQSCQDEAKGNSLTRQEGRAGA